MVWEYLRSDEFEKAVELSGGLCVVPIGCIEKHGAHMPLGADTIQARETCIRAAEKEPVVVFPTMYFGEKSGAGEYPGTLIFSLETRWHMFRETCKEIYRNGFKKILFANGHAGNNNMLGAFVRGMMQEDPRILIYTCPADLVSRLAIPDILADAESCAYLTEEDRAAMKDFLNKNKSDGHAGLSETAWVHHYHPELVPFDRIQVESGACIHRFDAFKEHNITTPLAWMADYPNSYHADTDYVINERIARALTEYSEEKLAETFRFLKNERISEEYHAQWLKKQ